MGSVETDVLRITYEERSGQGEHLPILWLQGLGADHTAWGVQLHHFGVTHRCFAPDNRDAGETAWLDTPGGVPDAYTVANMAADMAAFLTHLGLSRVHVVGLSMGASIAQELALRWPDRVSGLVLVSGLARARPRLRTLLEAWSTIYAAVDRETFYRQAAAWMFADPYFAHDRNINAMLGYVRRSLHPQAPEAFARQVMASLTHDTTARLSQIAAPTMIIGGTEDIMIPRQVQEELAAGIRGARMLFIEGAGHSVNLEAQIAFNAGVRSFLADVENRA